jgi:hypothetical protein
VQVSFTEFDGHQFRCTGAVTPLLITEEHDETEIDGF